MATRAASDGVMNLFLTLAVATSLAVGSVGYAAGSTPEWVVLKSATGLVAVGLIGWIVSAVVGAGAERRTHEDKGRNVDTTVSDTVAKLSDRKVEPENSGGEVVGS